MPIKPAAARTLHLPIDRSIRRSSPLGGSAGFLPVFFVDFRAAFAAGFLAISPYLRRRRHGQAIRRAPPHPLTSKGPEDVPTSLLDRPAGKHPFPDPNGAGYPLRAGFRFLQNVVLSAI